MAEMIELQIINKILNEKSLKFIKDNNISSDWFIQFNSEIKFINNHFKEYGVVPDKTTFLDKFNDFEFQEIKESEDYLRDKFKEYHLFNKALPIMKNVAKQMEENTFEAFKYLKANMDELTKDLSSVQPIDLISQADLRRDSLNNRASQIETNSIKTGFQELDDCLYGWMRGEELITIFARTGQGKTGLALYFLVNAWKQGYRVGMYSGEMTAERIGYRFDTLIQHYSNRELTTGTIGKLNEYNTYIDKLKNDTSKPPFYVITPYDLKGQATVSQLEEFVDKYKLDILVIDQYSLMKDERASKKNDTREELEHISSDLFQLSIKKKIPIIALSQANRMGVKGEKDKGTPELDTIYGADAIAQNSTKVISFKQKGNGIELSIKKNRDGRTGDTFTYSWDIDKGIFNYLPTGENEEDEEKKKGLKEQFKDKRPIF